MDMNALDAAKGYGGLEGLSTPKASPVAEGAKAFAAALDRADEATRGFAAGAVDTQSLIEAVAEAEMALQTAVTVRDRIVGAYQEVLRMPL